MILGGAGRGVGRRGRDRQGISYKVRSFTPVGTCISFLLGSAWEAAQSTPQCHPTQRRGSWGIYPPTSFHQGQGLLPGVSALQPFCVWAGLFLQREPGTREQLLAIRSLWPGGQLVYMNCGSTANMLGNISRPWVSRVKNGDHPTSQSPCEG